MQAERKVCLRPLNLMRVMPSEEALNIKATF